MEINPEEKRAGAGNEGLGEMGSREEATRGGEEATAAIPEERSLQEGEMPLSGHLQEFRKRLIICLVAVALASGAAYNFVDDIIRFISAPAGKLYFLNPAEVFFTYIQVAVFAGVLLTLPIICYELWGFIRPALLPSERRAVFWLIPAAVLLFYGGLAFSYIAVLPAAVRFFMGFATASLQPMFSLSSYLSFFIAFLLPFGIVFELPLVLFFLAKIGLISSKFLREKRRILIVLAFVFAAVVSPTTDIFTQVMLAVPIILLYEVSIALVRFVLRK